tara:strand:+ start:492 stop:689 length:198 start_codon:yes stop_codon:yes gene_type:complete
MKYKIPVIWSSRGVIEVNAESLKKAVEIVKKFEPIPISEIEFAGQYRIDEDGSELDLYNDEIYGV